MENYSADIMHDLLEGYLQREVSIILSRFNNTIDFGVDAFNKRISFIDVFNQRLTSFAPGSQDENMPTVIAAEDLAGHGLKQKAAQMFTFWRIMPVLIGDVVPINDPAWHIFLTMCCICDIIFAPIITDEHCSALEDMLEQHFHELKRIFPDELLPPKAHYMIHYPRIIR